MNATTTTDIAIVGGGLVGTPLAIMLARKGWSVALIEQQGAAATIAPGTRGYTALSAATVDTLSDQQLWSDASSDACAIKRVHVSHQGYFGSTQIDCEQHQIDALGYVVDNVNFLASFESALNECAVQRCSAAVVQQVEYHASSATVHYCKDNQKHALQARLVIAVDGVSSSLRDAAGIATEHTDYDQVGILGVVALNQTHNNVAYERFTPSGPLALLPRPDNTASFVYCINPDRQDQMNALSDAAFLESLQTAFGYRLGQFKSVGPRVFVPLVRIEAKQQVGQRLLLMGNALRLLHPVAGQGYNLAIRDAEALFNRLSDISIDPGSSALLQQFAESRHSDHQQVVRMTDLLARAFRGSASLPAHLRALGLLGLDRVPPLRNRFTQRSMGYRH